jgi:cytochrome c oxidase subunit 2
MRRLVTLFTLLGSLISCGGDATDTSDTAASTMSVSLSGSPSAQIWQGQCAACHGAAGEGNRALGAPTLTQLSADYLTRQLSHFVGGVRGAHPDDDAGKRMALSVANLNEADIPGLAALITTELPPALPAATITGDAARGEDYYVNICSACHSGNGQGNDALGAPALAGVNDWYLKSSYKSYLDGSRGTHPDDFYGAQMARLAPALAKGDDIDDVIAFIATLPPRRSP